MFWLFRLFFFVFVVTSTVSASALTQQASWAKSPLFRSKMGEMVTIEDGLCMECVSERPRIFRVRNLLSPSECDVIIDTALPYLEKSMVATNVDYTDATQTTFGRAEQDNFRLSDHAWLEYSDASVLSSLQTRIAKLTTLSNSYIESNCELLQVIRYESKGQFKPHQDSFAAHKRLLTFLVYLNTVDAKHEGGTWFPFGACASDRSDTEVTSLTMDEALLEAETRNILREEKNENEKGERGVDTNTSPSDTGFVQSPEQGTGLLFFNHLADGSLDSCAIHAGLPLLVDKGSGIRKWACNMWIGGDGE